MTIHVSESELALDVHALLAKVQQGDEVVIEHENRTIAVLKSPQPEGRLLSECLAIAEARKSSAVPDDEFWNDVEKGIAERSTPWNPPPWE